MTSQIGVLRNNAFTRNVALKKKSCSNSLGTRELSQSQGFCLYVYVRMPWKCWYIVVHWGGCVDYMMQCFSFYHRVFLLRCTWESSPNSPTRFGKASRHGKLTGKTMRGQCRCFCVRSVSIGVGHIWVQILYDVFSIALYKLTELSFPHS